MNKLIDYIPAITMTNSGVMSPLTHEQQQRRKLFTKYWDYYEGKHTKPLKVKPNQADDNVIENWSKIVVNRGVAFLFGKGIEFQTDSKTSERNAEESYLDGFWSNDPSRDFSPAIFLQKLAQGGGVTGTAVLRIYPTIEGYPTVRVIDSRIVDIVTDPDDVDHVLAYHVTWQSGKDWKRHRIVELETGQWEIYEGKRDGSKWREDEPILWDYNFPPIKHAQNLVMTNRADGLSDLADSDLNDSINFVESNTNRIVRFHAHPKTIVSGAPASSMQTKTGADGVWFFPDAAASVKNLEMSSDMQSSMEHSKNLKHAFNQVTGTPSFDPSDGSMGAMSGFALQILYGPLLEKTNVKRETYGALLQWLNRAILILGGKNDVVVDNVWPYPLPVSSKERAEEFEIIARVDGVDPYQAAITAGYDEETAKRLTENGNQLLIPDTDLAF